MSLQFNLIYLACLIISGAILAGVFSYYLVKALAQTGADGTARGVAGHDGVSPRMSRRAT